MLLGHYAQQSTGWSREWLTKISMYHMPTIPLTQITKGIRNLNLHIKTHLIQLLDKIDPTPITIPTTFQITLLASLGNHKPNHSPITNNGHQNYLLLVLNHNVKSMANMATLLSTATIVPTSITSHEPIVPIPTKCQTQWQLCSPLPPHQITQAIKVTLPGIWTQSQHNTSPLNLDIYRIHQPTLVMLRSW